MEVLRDDRMAADSLAEAQLIGKVATYGSEDGATELSVKFPGESRPRDEIEFLNQAMRHGVWVEDNTNLDDDGRPIRTFHYGQLTVSKSVASAAESGFKAIVESGASYENVSPQTAQLCLNAIEKSRSQRKVDPDTVDPDDLAYSAAAEISALRVIEKGEVANHLPPAKLATA